MVNQDASTKNVLGTSIMYCSLHNHAPELLEALKEEHKLVDPDCEGDCATAKLISKAEGKTND